MHFFSNQFRCSSLVFAAFLSWQLVTPNPTAANEAAIGSDNSYDVVIYGGTSAGIAAAVQVKRMGHSVIVIEPTSRIGGLTTGGLGQTDIGRKTVVGGVSREFYRRVRNHYNEQTNWNWQKSADYKSGGQSRTSKNEDTMWTFEPSAALSIMEGFVKEYDIPVSYGERLVRTPAAYTKHSVTGVRTDGGKIVSIKTETGKVYRGQVFIDATYEGDLMAGAGVDYVVGREANETYGETLNGVQTKYAVHHQFRPEVDPYLTPGDANSGLLPGIDPQGPGKEGDADPRVQAYCFRMCLTDHPDNRLPFTKPASYAPLQYELLFRNFEAGAKIIPWSFSDMPNRKTDINNNRGFSTDYITQNYDYPEASYVRREEIIQQHREYQQGLMWTLANHPRVPEYMRQEVSRWGPCRDEFERADGWQQQLYIREARRMVGQHVMTQHHCQGEIEAAKPIGLAAYTMDSHHVQRHVDPQGYVKNEGDVQVGGFSPYPIDYGSIVPKKDQCSNLLVPVCISASHIAFGSIRMEPVFMVLGQSAATAAVQAIESNVAIQDIDYDRLRKRLLADRQVIEWTGPKTKPTVGTDPSTFEGIVQDDNQIQHDGFDRFSRSAASYVGAGYRHDDNTAKGHQRARFKLQVPKAGRYIARLAWTPNANRATNVPVTVYHAAGETTVKINQKKKPSNGNFGTLGTYNFEAGEVKIEVSNAGTDGYVIADAVQLVPVDGNDQ